MGLTRPSDADHGAEIVVSCTTCRERRVHAGRYMTVDGIHSVGASREIRRVTSC